MNPMEATLVRFGWNEVWEREAEAWGGQGRPGRVSRAGRLLLVETEEGALLAECPSDVSSRPVCGDWVMVEPLPSSDEREPRGRIRCTLPRRNTIERCAVGVERPQVLVANVDDVWLVCGLDRSQGIRSLGRYQALCRIDGATVTVVLNKSDATDELERQIDEARAKAPGLDVLTVSAVKGDGLELLASRLQRYRTLALLGPSGAGKSTLINALTQRQEQVTQPVRRSDRRGCHTTSAGQLLMTHGGALIIDTPGLRELGLWRTARLDNSFADIYELAQGCRFRDCSHAHEPGCHVRSALEQGLLASERFLEYLELTRERATRAKLVKGRKRRYG